MFSYNNTHIFTGYLKQLLTSVNIPACKIYTKAFADYYKNNGTEDPRVIESFDSLHLKRPALRINYLKNNKFFNYFTALQAESLKKDSAWRQSILTLYSPDKADFGLTRCLHSTGPVYDTATHEYLGDYLRFLRDYHNVNLLSMYNCFNNTVCNNINLTVDLEPTNSETTAIAKKTSENIGKTEKKSKITFNSFDQKYKIYAIPVKLFAEYTIAIDSSLGIELFCGFYRTTLANSEKALDLFRKTYQKINKTTFNTPILYTKLNVSNWLASTDQLSNLLTEASNKITRWDIAEYEHDLKLFIKVPIACKSSITILEGNFLHYNDARYFLANTDSAANDNWQYDANHCALNFGTVGNDAGRPVSIDMNDGNFKPISKLQLLAFNTGESYPFADRLIEYIIGSAITPIDEIADNIKRTQSVMNDNKHYFKVYGRWEPKMQKILYDSLINTGPVTAEKGHVINRHSGNNPTGYGYLPTLGHTSKSMLYDILGYVDRDAEKWYACWTADNKSGSTASSPKMLKNIHNVDIYDNLFDL